ncbi:hypothetical protein [Bradyrhizobium centrolobii]|uniref:hypothetical protein n=1 Tax=Bradyrhizobium centrolobii TaxID=1505087 RepID=UPI0032221767
MGAKEVRASTADGSDRGRRGDPACGGRADKHRLYHVIRKPTEPFLFAGNSLDKEPAETWRQYGPLFRSLSTDAITPELLAALAQVERSRELCPARTVNVRCRGE